METKHAHDHAAICFDCAEACERCVTACLTENGHGDMVRCIQLCRDCADICVLCARLDARGSDFSKQLMVLCADICDACAEECEKHAEHDQHCRACAEASRRCAQDCREMAKA